MVLWLARQDGRDKDTLWVRLAQRRISPGTPLDFDVGVTKSDGTATADIAVEAVAVSPSGGSVPVRVPRKGDSFVGSLAEFAEPGDWKLVVRATLPGGPALERTARFTVFRQDLELANPRANPLLMRQIAEPTPGGVRSPEELAELFEEIRTAPGGVRDRRAVVVLPWDTWPMFLLMAACLCLEWFFRKRWGLV